ncbi:hypothetical protein ACUN0C_04270 [Faunimonas sp. B44]
MPDSNEPSCWRTAALTFGLLASIVLVIALVAGGADVAAVAAK